MPRRMHRGTLVAVLIGFISMGGWVHGGLAWAQGSASASIVGQVEAVEGGRLPPDLELRLLAEGSEEPRTIQVSKKGSFYVPNLEPGAYTLEGSAGDFRSGPYLLTLFHGQTVKIKVELEKPRPDFQVLSRTALLADEKREDMQAARVAYFVLDESSNTWRRRLSSMVKAQLFAVEASQPRPAVKIEEAAEESDPGG